ncbi:unnamed protein product [Phytophthora fragariaefolia]|uniref:Unnamed protein product n=1 Tax=Phytophthora fragariaefolia TaxID=1490495 RepID=A0A9W7D379_9STRA|nr:unnamed protein product [Phytophthora fragariaefolia]
MTLAFGCIGVTAPHQRPAEIVEILCGFFTGFDAFNLSLTNAWWRSYLLDELFWMKCFQGLRTREKHTLGFQSWKKRYVQSRSILFKALKSNHKLQFLGSFAYFVCRGNKQGQTHFQLTHMGGEIFSFDLWFSLLPETSDHRFGGIIYGLQSSSQESCELPHYYHQFVMVSITGDLYCSVLAEQTNIASGLEPSRWYHVALTYNHTAQLQEVHLNGVKVHSKTGTWRYQRHFMTYGQVGSGVEPSGSGWYGFHGVIDAFRVWRGIFCSMM